MRKSKRPRGFTLIETVVAMVVFAMGFMGVLGLTLWFVQADVFNARMSEALAMAQARMEQLLATDPSGLAGGSSVSNEFTCTWTVDDPFTEPDLHALAVEVTWVDGRQRTNRIELTSILSEP